MRRDALVRFMRRRGHATVDELSMHLGVSRRTVLRDMSALRDRGFGIAGEGGPGGGVQLDPGTVLVSSQLRTDEVVALILSVAVLQAAPWMPFSDQAERALAKIEGALAAERVRELRLVLGRILVGQPMAGASLSLGPVDRSLLVSFERAFSQRTVLTFDYLDRNGRRSSRTVEPHALLVRAPLWYVIAWDRQKEAVRLFRMDRIRSARPVEGETFLARALDLVTGACPDARPLHRDRRTGGMQPTKSRGPHGH